MQVHNSFEVYNNGTIVLWNYEIEGVGHYGVWDEFRGRNFHELSKLWKFRVRYFRESNQIKNN